MRNNGMRRSFSRAHVFLLGLGMLTLATQTTIVREILGGYGGSEIYLAFFYAAWLSGLGSGAYLGRRTTRRSRHIVPLSLVMIVGVPLSIAATRFLAVLPGVQPGVILPWWAVSLPIMGIVFPLALVAGMLFPIATSFIGAYEMPARPFGMSYMVEAAGSLLSGTILSLWLLERANSFMALLPFIGVFSAGFLLLIRQAGFYSGMRIRLIFGISLIHAVLWPTLHHSLEEYIWNQRIGEIPLVWSGPSQYGYYQVADQEGAITFYVNGIPSAACVSDPLDEVYAQIFRLAAGSDPEAVVSGNMRYAVVLSSSDATTRVIEHDGMLIKLWYSFCDPRVGKVIHDDIRIWLSRNTGEIDLLIVDAPEPTTAQANRYYTKEFFSSVRERLSPSGVFILSAHLPASHLLGAGIEMARIVYGTMMSVFPSVLVSPGPGGWFFASADSNFTGEKLYQRIAESDSTGVLRAGLAMMFPYHATKDFEKALISMDRPINTDAHPRAYTSQLRVALARLGLPYDVLSRISTILFAFLLVCLIVLSVGINRIHSPVRRISAVMGHTGFISFATSFLLLIGFQHTAGTLYSRIALLTGFFMAGLTTGAFLGSRHPFALRFIDRLLSLILFIMAFMIPEHISPIGYYGLAYLFACIVGLQFPSGLERLMAHGKSGSYSAGILDSADHIGAGIGALMAGIILLPSLGFRWAFLLLGMSKLISGYMKSTVVGNDSRGHEV